MFIFSQAPTVRRSGKLPSTKWKRNHIPPFSLLVVFSYGWERGQHKVNTLKYYWNPALRIYIIHWPSAGSLYRHALTRSTYGCLEGRISSFSYLQCLGCPRVYRLGKKLWISLHKSKFATCFYNKTLENVKEINIQSPGEKNICSFSSKFFFKVVKPKLSEAQNEFQKLFVKWLSSEVLRKCVQCVD